MRWQRNRYYPLFGLMEQQVRQEGVVKIRPAIFHRQVSEIVVLEIMLV